VLVKLGADLNRVRQQVLQLLSGFISRRSYLLQVHFNKFIVCDSPDSRTGSVPG